MVYVEERLAAARIAATWVYSARTTVALMSADRNATIQFVVVRMAADQMVVVWLVSPILMSHVIGLGSCQIHVFLQIHVFPQIHVFHYIHVFLQWILHGVVREDGDQYHGCQYRY